MLWKWDVQEKDYISDVRPLHLLYFVYMCVITSRCNQRVSSSWSRRDLRVEAEADEAENTVIFLCGATTANVYWWLWPFTNYWPPQVSLHLTSMPSTLVFLPLSSPVAHAFSSTFPAASKLLNRKISQCLTWGQMTSTELPLHTHRHTHAHINLV